MLPFVFSDECRFCDCPDSHRVWIQKGTYQYAALAPTQKFNRFSLMAWGAIGFGLKSDLIFFDDGNVTSNRYINAISGFCTKADATFGPRNWVFVQDGASSHTSKAAIAALCRRCIVNPEWPPNSPDLNPIEMVWGIMKRQMTWAGVTDKDQAKSKLIALWEAIPQATIDALRQSFPTRVKMVRDAVGQTIQPLLSNRQSSVPQNYLPDRPRTPPFVPWTCEEDARLNELRAAVRRSGGRNRGRMRECCRSQKKSSWQSMAAQFPGRSASSVKSRWRTLEVRERNDGHEEDESDSEEL
jgi:hypothetical protein